VIAAGRLRDFSRRVLAALSSDGIAILSLLRDSYHQVGPRLPIVRPRFFGATGTAGRCCQLNPGTTIIIAMFTWPF
jgi:hypothetical protein